MHFTLLAVALLLLSSCTGMTDAAPRVTHVHTLVEISMAQGRYSLSAAGPVRATEQPRGFAAVGREELPHVFDAYFQSYSGADSLRLFRDVYHVRPVIVVYSYVNGPPSDGVYEPEYLAPIIAAARKYGCDVCVVHPAVGAVEFQWAWRDATKPQSPPAAQ